MSTEPEMLDWAERWRSQVRTRAAQVERLRQDQGADYWASRARRFQTMTSVVGSGDPTLAFLRPWLSPERTLLDVGAGYGRYALALAPLVGELIAVEPAAVMADLLRRGARERGIEHIRVVEDLWERCASERADIVFCAHVLYPIAEVVPFIRALDAAARKLCVLALRIQPAEVLLREPWLALHGEPPQSDPAFLDAYNLLWQIGIAPQVTLVPATPMRFADQESALAWGRDMLWVRDDAATNARLWPLLAPLLEPHPDGGSTVLATGRQTALVWWEPGTAG